MTCLNGQKFKPNATGFGQYVDPSALLSLIKGRYIKMNSIVLGCRLTVLRFLPRSNENTVFPLCQFCLLLRVIIGSFSNDDGAGVTADLDPPVHIR